MSIPLNELSAIYNQSIGEGCDKKKEKKEEERSDSMPKGDVGYDIHKRAVKQYNKQNPSKKVNEGHCEVEGVPCSPVEKKKEKKKVKENYSNWRTDLREVVDVEDKEEKTDSSPDDSSEDKKDQKGKIKEKNIKNKIRINPPQGVTEAFEEIGAVVVEMYELDEADMTGAPSIKDAKPAKKTDVKYDSHMKVMAPSIKKEGTSVKDQMKVSQEYFKKRKAMTPDEKASEKEKHAKARAKISAMHKKPNPYKSRVGESD